MILLDVTHRYRFKNIKSIANLPLLKTHTITHQLSKIKCRNDVKESKDIKLSDLSASTSFFTDGGPVAHCRLAASPAKKS